jgi:ribosomal lysine N-methyltransferase 2
MASVLLYHDDYRPQPNTPLFTVPETAHLNLNSLSPLYGLSITSGLTAIQLISMHLFLHRPGPGGTDADFGPYISILPERFDGHPLSWLISSSRGEPQDVVFLLDCLPPATQRALNAMADRFWKDWKVVSQTLVNIFSKHLK